MFNKLDVSGDGSVSMQELQARMESLPARSRGQWEAVMNEMDKDGSGEIEFIEFDVVVGKWIRAKLLLGLEAALELDENAAKTVDQEEQEHTEQTQQTQAELQPTTDLTPEPEADPTEDVSSDIDDIELSEDENEDLEVSARVGEPGSKPLVDMTPQDLSGSVEDENFAFDEDEIDDLVASAGGEDPKLETNPVKPPNLSEPPPLPRQRIELQPQPQPPPRMKPPAPLLRQGGDSGATDSGSSRREAETPKENLLRWAQERSRIGARMRSADATGEIPAPKGFRKGFVDGLAFCAILAAEGHLDWAEVSVPADVAEGGMLNVEQKLANLQLAFGVADRVLGLDGTMLDAQDMAKDGQYDDKSVMTYVGELRKHLRKHASTAEGNISGGKLQGGTSMDEFDEDEINALISSAGAEI